MQYNEPVKNEQFTFDLIPRNQIRNSPYQRDYSSTLVNKLLNSVAKGFIIPVVVVPSDDGGYLVIDGQHRLGGLDKAITDDNPLIPCIILPKKFEDFPLFYNIEKGDNIKDKSTKIYRIYLDKIQEEWTERDLLPSVNYEPYIFTIAFSYSENGLKSPSLVEGPVKKLDNKEITTFNEDGYMKGMPLSESVEIRRGRAALAKELEDTITEMASEYYVSDFNLKKSMVSQSSQTLWGRKRNLGIDPEEGLPMLIEQIRMMDWSWMSGK